MNQSNSPPARTSARVLVVDDEESLRYFLRRGLARLGFDVEASADADIGLARFDAHPPDVVVVDLKMPGPSGLDLLDAVRQRDPDAIVVLMTGHGTIQVAVDAMRRGAWDFVTKPFEIEELAMTIERALHHRATVRENRELRRMVDHRSSYAGLIGQSPAMRSVFAAIDRVCGNDATVLITGESGTGKELVARAIHAASRRNAAPFVALHCGSVPGALFDSEVFGHVVGAFTGASRAREGKVRRADGGTLFLDDVAELEIEAQARIQRFLEERQFSPLGSNETVSVDLRVIATTSTALDVAVQQGTFRRELFWRLAVVPIEVPPLRARREDIPALISHFLARHAAGIEVEPLPISLEASVLLAGYSWPGNVRELQNVVERMAVLHGDVERLEAEHVPDPIRAAAGAAPVAEAGSSAGDYQDALAGFERSYLVDLFERTAGNVSEAARVAGLSRGHLHRKARQLGVEPERFR